jgi:hypothetical protein
MRMCFYKVAGLHNSVTVSRNSLRNHCLTVDLYDITFFILQHLANILNIQEFYVIIHIYNYYYYRKFQLTNYFKIKFFYLFNS